MNKLAAAGVAGIAGLLMAGSAGAQAHVSPSTFLTVVAEGEVTRAPDVAELSGGVVTTAPTAAAAMAENARAMSSVVAALRSAGGISRLRASGCRPPTTMRNASSG
jgi:hypothetical protein